MMSSILEKKDEQQMLDDNMDKRKRHASITDTEVQSSVFPAVFHPSRHWQDPHRLLWSRRRGVRVQNIENYSVA
jgi:hypothetical protein